VAVRTAAASPCIVSQRFRAAVMHAACSDGA
jgi:hypothetical protein